MAKKSYTTTKCLYFPEVKESGLDNVAIKFVGQNKKGTECETTVVIDEFIMPHLITQFAKIAKSRLERAKRNMESIETAAKIL